MSYLVSELQQLTAEAVDGSSGLKRHFESSSCKLGVWYKFERFGYSKKSEERSGVQQWHVYGRDATKAKVGERYKTDVLGTRSCCGETELWRDWKFLGNDFRIQPANHLFVQQGVGKG